jgi:uncharacterized protein with PIN domain
LSRLVVDTSAVMTIVRDEPGADELLTHLISADERVMSAGTLLELGIALEARLGPAGRSVMDRFLGDCFAYGLADVITGAVPCVGDDFAATDIEVLRPERPR